MSKKIRTQNIHGIEAIPDLQMKKTSKKKQMLPSVQN